MGRSTGVPESALIHVAVRTLGLSEVKPFDARAAIIEARLASPAPLVGMTLAGFADELSSDSPAPGGGSVAAYAGALAAGLATMVANLSHPKRGFEAKQPALERIAVRGQALKDRLLAAVDADTAAFDRYLAAMRMPKESAEERALRDAAMVVATIATIEVPLGTLEACPEIVELCLEIGEIGLQASLSDAGTGAAMARAAASGAYQNVCINLPGLADRQAAAQLLTRADGAWETDTRASPRRPRRSSSTVCGRRRTSSASRTRSTGRGAKPGAVEELLPQALPDAPVVAARDGVDLLGREESGEQPVRAVEVVGGAPAEMERHRLARRPTRWRASSRAPARRPIRRSSAGVATGPVRRRARSLR